MHAISDYNKKGGIYMGKKRIIAYRNGVPVGYVRSVSYKKGTCQLTREKEFAKTYASQDRLTGDIDVIAWYGVQNGVVFGME